MIWLFDLVFFGGYYVLNGLAFMRLVRLAGRKDLDWMAWVPICSTIQKLLLIKKNGWWILILLIPIVGTIFKIIWNVKLLRAFGKRGLFAWVYVLFATGYYILWLMWSFLQRQYCLR